MFRVEWTHRELHPDLQRAELASSCWTMSPYVLRAEAVGLEPTSGAWPPPVFKTGSSSGRMTSVRVAQKAPGVGIEPTTSWFRARRHYQQQLPRNVFHASSGRRIRTSIAWFKARRPTVSRSPNVCRIDRECSAGIEPACSAWKADAFADRPRARSGRRGSRTLKAHRSTVFETAAIAHWLALPYSHAKAAAAGIEPAKGRLTGACLYQHRPHRNESGWQDLNLRSQAPRACAMPGFATPCQGQGADSNRRSLLPKQRITRLSHARNEKRPAGVEPALPPWQGSRLPLHHGRVESLVELSKIRAPGGTRTHVAALRVRGPRRWTTSAFHSVGSEGLEPSPTWLRARHAAASTLIPCSCFASRCLSAQQWARRESNPRPGPYKRPALNH